MPEPSYHNNSFNNTHIYQYYPHDQNTLIANDYPPSNQLSYRPTLLII
jgi:hypothetical protein